MKEQHPITTPPELAAEWVAEIYGDPAIPLHPVTLQLVERAAQWGADQELEACCEYLVRCAQWEPEDVAELRAARRPKPPSLKEQALEIVRRTPVNSAGLYSYEHIEIIRRALEQLPDNE